MKAVSLWQPWATLVVLGLKKVETRGWYTSYRGPLLIHAAKTFPPSARRFAEAERALGRLPARIPFGALIGRVDLDEVLETQNVEQIVSALERLYGDFAWGRFAWFLENAKEFPEPIPCRGMQRLFNVVVEVDDEAAMAELGIEDYASMLRDIDGGGET